jgi:hypothetical protein
MDIRAGIIAREGIDSHTVLWDRSLYKICPWTPEVIPLFASWAWLVTIIRDDSGAAIV